MMGDLYIETPIGSAKCKLKEVGGALSLPYPVPSSTYRDLVIREVGVAW